MKDIDQNTFYSESFPTRILRKHNYKVAVYEIAKRIGVSNQTVYNWFNGKTNPTFSNFTVLCQVLDLPADEVFKLLNKRVIPRK